MRGDLLEGVRVLDLTRLLPGPLCTQHLADLGADVIKIEDTHGGDYGRHGLGTGGDTDPDYFATVNRGKRSLALDLKQTEGRELFCKLARTADIVVEGFRPGVMERLGIGYASLQQINSKIVFCSISGYGQTGPYRNRAGHDLNYCALTGMIDQTGQPASDPVIPAFQIADLAGGTLTALATLLAALYKAQRSGRGCHIDVAMADSVMAHSILSLAVNQSVSVEQGRGQGALNGGLPCYGVYRTADGRHLAVAALERKFWERMCHQIERPDLIERHSASGTDAQLVRGELEKAFGRRTLKEWLDLFDDADCCVSPVLRFDEALEHPQFIARALFNRDTSGSVRSFGFPAVIDGQRYSAECAAPTYAQHGRAIVGELGYSDEQITALIDSGVIRLAGRQGES
ncbi:MAG: CoA transferase [Proteobacteria bacterium]|nr:MAG: CoA transferase [Pseudomonadota bacterium]